MRHKFYYANPLPQSNLSVRQIQNLRRMRKGYISRLLFLIIIFFFLISFYPKTNDRAVVTVSDVFPSVPLACFANF
jgi:ABC-type microcin C transport system permease subunit YejE